MSDTCEDLYPGSRVIQTSRNVLFPLYNTADTTEEEDFILSSMQLEGENNNEVKPHHSSSTEMEVPKIAIDPSNQTDHSDDVILKTLSLPNAKAPTWCGKPIEPWAKSE